MSQGAALAIEPEQTSGGRAVSGQIADQRLRAVFAYWRGRCPGRSMPSRADVDPAELKPYLPNIALIDVESDPPRYRYRLAGTLSYHAVLGAFQPVPVPAPGRLPRAAHIGPVSWVLGVGAFVFGIGKAISGSRISAHLYRLEGSPTAPFMLLAGAVAGLFSHLLPCRRVGGLACPPTPGLLTPQVWPRTGCGR
jgi:hypothetical protein